MVKKSILNIIIVISLFSLTIYKLVDLKVLKNEEYNYLYLKNSKRIVEGKSAPRGRILDRNGIVLVDNVGYNQIVYHESSKHNKKEIAKLANEKIHGVLEASLDEVKRYYIDFSGDDIVSSKVLDDYEYRKISDKDLFDLKYNMLSDDIINNYTKEELQEIHLYYILNKGYLYDTKIIKDNVTDEECAYVSESNIPGVTCELSWKRVYKYDDYLKSIYGTIGLIPYEKKEEYLNNGNDLDDIVGISGLEYQYNDYLRGSKALYLVNKDGSLSKIKDDERGNDLYLSIDINLQIEVNEILKENVLKAKTMNNTEYYNHSYVLISDPNIGSIVALSGIQILGEKDDYSFKEITSNVINSSYTVGSVVKGASITVGHQNGLIEAGKKINDACVKLYLVPEKCSFKRLGMIDDITALKTSSNYYQFLIAIKLTGNEYKRNVDIKANEEHFKIYRNTFASFGLGNYTGIDLPGESLGIIGSKVANDLLLNLAIGQYDTYTPIELLQYINTISQNGIRNKLNLVNKIVDLENNVVYEYYPVILNKIEDTGYFERIKEGFRQVLDGGTGRGYTSVKYNPAGKTGTSEVYYSSEVTTITQSYIMFAPVDNPKYSMVVMSPNISFESKGEDYTAPINRYISRDVSKILFEKY